MLHLSEAISTYWVITQLFPDYLSHESAYHPCDYFFRESAYHPYDKRYLEIRMYSGKSAFESAVSR